MTISVCKFFEFEASHFLEHHLGKCANLHGHSYKLEVEVTGDVITKVGPDQGMVADFSDLSAIVKELIIEPLDHAFLAESDKQGRQITKACQPDVELGENGRKFVTIGMTTTAENLVLWIASVLAPYLADSLEVKLTRVRLYETRTGYAEIRP